MWFLIEYDRPQGELIKLIEFDETERDSAEQARLALEIELNQQGIDREVVILQATDQDALRVTHRRYFENLEQLVSG